MATRRDKEKVIDEVWDDDRIRSFLQREPAADAGVHRDHFRLLNAYQSMRVGDFRRFLVALREEDGDLDAPDARGRSAADIIARHRHGDDFVRALVAEGARSPITAQES